MTTTIEAPAEAIAAKPAKRVKPVTVDLITQFCKSDRDELHAACRGSGANGAGSTWYCQCDCHVEHPTCRDCGARDVEVTLEGTCVDVDGCQTTQTIRTASNPVHRTIREALTHAEQQAAIKAEADRARRAREVKVTVDPETGEATVKQPVAKAPRTPKAPPTPQRCHCGCAGMTKGGKFVAGHDARLKGMLVRAARQTPPETGKPATKAQAVNAMAELIARNWPRKGVSAEITRPADAMFDQYGPDPIIDRAVSARYEGR